MKSTPLSFSGPGRPDRAIAELQDCLRTHWYRAESWHLLSALLAKTGRAEQAAKAHAIAEMYDVRLSARPPVLQFILSIRLRCYSEWQ